MPFDVASLYRQSNAMFGAVQRTTWQAAQAVGANSEALAKVNSPHVTYQMRGGWYHRCYVSSGTVIGELGNKCAHAIFPEAGTGVWGPKSHPIYPRSRKCLSWIGADGKRRFARSVKGQKPQFVGYSALFGKSPPFAYSGQVLTRNILIIERELKKIE